MTVGHGKGSQSSKTCKLPSLLDPEAVPGELVESDRHLTVGDRGIVCHEELSETGRESEKHLLVRGFDGILPGRESVKV